MAFFYVMKDSINDGTATGDAGLAKDVETGEVGERVEGVSKVSIKNVPIITSKK